MSLKYCLLIVYSWVLVGLGNIFGQTKSRNIEVNILDVPSCYCALGVTLNQLKNATACDRSDGSIDVAITGGTGAYTFAWTNQSGTLVSSLEDASNLPPGFYFLSVKDSNQNCIGQRYFEIGSDIVLTTSATLSTSCSVPNGTITTSVSGGSGNFAYEWTFPDGTKITNKNLSGLKAAQYQLKVTDLTKGCITTKTVSVKSSSSLAASIVKSTPNTSCVTPNGAIDLLVSGGSGSYSFYWYDVNYGAYVSYQEDLNKIKGGDYSAYIIDNVSGCSAYLFGHVDEQTSVPAYSIEVSDNSSCSEPFNGAVELTPSGSSGPFSITWSGATGSISNGMNPTGLAPGKYGFKLTDQSTGCSITKSFTSAEAVVVGDESSPKIAITIEQIANNTNCSSPNGAINVTIDTDGYPYDALWSGPNAFSSNQPDLTGLPGGTYSFTVSVACNQPPIIEPPALALRTSDALQQELVLRLEDFISDPNQNLDLSSVQILEQPKSKAKARITDDHFLVIDYSGITYRGSDILKLRACDLLEACTENTISIDVEVKGDIIVFNAVSPTSSGDNKFMRIANLPIDTENEVFIFNRWGDLVFHIFNYDNATAGKRFEGVSDQGIELPTGTYFYKIEVADGRQALTGYLALKR